MHDRHTNRKQYFLEQGITTKKYVIPFIEEFKKITHKTKILEVGCGEGGNLAPFIQLNCEVVGVDLNSRQIDNAKLFIQEDFPNANATFVSEDIYKVKPDDFGRFDVIMLRDVIEHIPNQEVFLKHLKKFLNKDGVVFFGFPPWRMPFGGHQQVCRGKILSKLPYFHLFPSFIYKSILKIFGEKDDVLKSLLEIKSTGISINKFQNIIEKNNYKFLKKEFYLINPNYEIKFGLKPRIQFKIISWIPYFRDFVTTCYYCLVVDDDLIK